MSILSLFLGFISGAAAMFGALSVMARRINRDRIKAGSETLSDKLDGAIARLEQIEALDPPEPRARVLARKALGELE